MRGQVLSYDGPAGTGTIAGQDGERYRVARADLKAQSSLPDGATVDFVPEGRVAREVFLVQGASTGGEQSRVPAGHKSLEHGLGPWGYFKKCLALYADGKGRATRGEYWSFVLFYFLSLLPGLALVLAGGATTDPATGEPSAFGGVLMLIGIVLLLVAVLGLIIPSITVAVRRLHDIGLSGWLYLVSLVPYIGELFLFVCSLIPSSDKENQHGPSPRMPQRAADAFA